MEDYKLVFGKEKKKGKKDDDKIVADDQIDDEALQPDEDHHLDNMDHLAGILDDADADAADEGFVVEKKHKKKKDKSERKHKKSKKEKKLRRNAERVDTGAGAPTDEIAADLGDLADDFEIGQKRKRLVKRTDTGDAEDLLPGDAAAANNDEEEVKDTTQSKRKRTIEDEEE